MSAGILCAVQRVHSEPRLIQKRPGEPTPDEALKLDEDIRKVIEEIHHVFGRSERENPRSFALPPAGRGADVGAYYGVVSDLYAVLRPLLRAGLLEELPGTLLCVLAGRQDCGLQAELAKTVSLELGGPLLALLSSLRSQTCAGPSSSLGTLLRTAGEPAAALLSGFQQTVASVLSAAPPSGGLMSAVSGLADAAVAYVSKHLATFLQAPMDYVKIALQFGIRIPSLDGQETCEQGKT